MKKGFQNALANTAKKGELTEASFLELHAYNDREFILSFKGLRLNPLSGIKITYRDLDDIRYGEDRTNLITFIEDWLPYEFNNFAIIYDFVDWKNSHEFCLSEYMYTITHSLAKISRNVQNWLYISYWVLNPADIMSIFENYAHVNTIVFDNCDININSSEYPKKLHQSDYQIMFKFYRKALSFASVKNPKISVLSFQKWFINTTNNKHILDFDKFVSELAKSELKDSITKISLKGSKIAVSDAEGLLKDYDLPNILVTDEEIDWKA